MRGQVNTCANRLMNPRISIQMAICTEGRLYCGLSQINTDHNSYCTFISHLATKLTAEDRDWRENTLLLIDGARY